MVSWRQVGAGAHPIGTGLRFVQDARFSVAFSTRELFAILNAFAVYVDILY